MRDYVTYLRKISEVVISHSGNWEDMAIAVQSYHAVLSEITGIQGAIKNRVEGYDTALPSGFALSPGYAADCTLDTKRTVKYIQALEKAVRQLLEAEMNLPVNILYAGCGPFAPFAIPLTECFSSDQIQFTVLDIHQQSIDAVKKAAEVLNIKNYFRQYINCDATEYQHAESYPLHILVTETMHRALSKEPHVRICLNLMPQLEPDALVIPEEVTLTACVSQLDNELQFLGNEISREEINRRRTPLGEVFSLKKDEVYQLNSERTEISCPSYTIEKDTGVNDTLVITTTIKLLDSIVLQEKESGITFPIIASDAGSIEKGDCLDFHFSLAAPPELKYSKSEKRSDVLQNLMNI